MSFIRTLGTLFMLQTLGACDSVEPTQSGETEFQQSWASTWCDRQEECALADFELAWQDKEACKDAKTNLAEFNSDWDDLVCGDFSRSAGATCLQAMRSLACDDWSDDDWRSECSLVYGC